MRIVREVATHFHRGARLMDIAEQCGLDRGTTRRLLACLVRERMVEQRASDRRYVPGPMLFELGLTLPAHAALQAACRQPLAQVARQFQGSAFMYLRSGKEVVCLAREDARKVQGVWSQEGTRKPLLGTTAALAILISLPRAEADAIAREHLATLTGVNDKRAATLRKVLRQSRALGFGINEGEIVIGLSSFGVALRDERGDAFAAISFVGTGGPYPEGRRMEIVAALRVQAAVIEERAAALFARQQARSIEISHTGEPPLPLW